MSEIADSTVIVGRKRLDRLHECEALLARFCAIAANMSDGPYQWGLLREATAGKWLAENLSIGSGDCHLVILPKHERAVIGPDPLAPERAVTMCVTGNGPMSKANAQGIIDLLTVIAEFEDE